MLRRNIKRITLLVCALALVSLAVNSAYASYTFKVHNKTDSNIVKLFASEDGKTYREFDIGAGIAAGKTVTMEWSKSTDNGNCEWYFKAQLDDGEETDPVEFDFCEKNLVLEIQ
ncbi:MAG: hypothetical protein WBV94_22090 [Blastocatellia bacterium]